MQFANVSGLKRASPVRVSGVNVGKVEKIEFMDFGKVLVVASLPPKIQPRVDATAQIVSVTLVGDYAMDFDPGQRRRGPAARPGDPGHPGPGADRAGRGARRSGRQRAARRAGDREPADCRPALRHAGPRCRPPSRRPSRRWQVLATTRTGADGGADEDHVHLPLARGAARQHAGQSGAVPDARPGGHAHRQPGRHDVAARRRRRAARQRARRGASAARERSASSRPTAGSTPTSGTCRSR